MTVQEYLLYVVIPILCLALIIIFVRFIKGPHVVDRVVALDLIITSGVGLIGVFCILYENSSFLDTATILALIAFLSTIAFAYYLDKGNRTDKNE
ncbi:cation:proton antiporter [Moheibacter sediminis]|uniref:Multisubunit sodium/proton antiporter, MrpF subunit n=1 Tax=Moheibacter sediminis TaxID=1434700 RepID=A0A1W1Z3K8_9FLAO|nr:cation:proton antiporter [Moheibacter sediminis]SMC42954.1 multisubunit sodium/proton antiporter, MrpF subunit [Moheibacter sediminis]